MSRPTRGINHRRTGSNSNVDSSLVSQSTQVTANNMVTYNNNNNNNENNPTMQSDIMPRPSSNTTNSVNTTSNKEFLKLAQKVDCSGMVPTPRFGHIMVMVSPTKAVLFGGAVGDTRTFGITNETFCYNVMTKIWTKLNSKG